MSHSTDANINGSELLEAQAHMWNQIFNFMNSMCLKCAVELGIPDIIHRHGKPITISELDVAISIHPTKSHCLPRLMRVLVHSGIFTIAKTNTQNDEKEEEEGYVLTNSSRLLLKDSPFSIIPYMKLMLDPFFIKPWHTASNWFLNDDPTPFQTAHGMPIWEYTGRDPKLNDEFNDCMTGETRLLMTVLVDERKEVFDGLSSLVDVAGGVGTAAKVIADKFPHIVCTVLDLPHVVAGQRDSQNLKFVGGNMFEGVPPADAIMIKSTLHAFSDEECLKILEQCKKSINEKKGGKLIIVDMVMGNEKRDHKDIETLLFYDMLMMVAVTGCERNEKEWAKLFFDAGFSRYKIIPNLGLRSIIEVFP